MEKGPRSKNSGFVSKGTTDDTIQALLRHVLINGILPKNDDTDKFLTKLSGGVFDLKDDNQQSELIKQLSGKLTTTQISSVMDAPNFLQTLIFVLFLIRFVPKLANNKYKQQLNRSIKFLQKKLAEPQLVMTDFKDLANNLIFNRPELI